MESPTRRPLVHTFPKDKKTPPKHGGVSETNVINAGPAIISGIEKGEQLLPFFYFFA